MVRAGKNGNGGEAMLSGYVLSAELVAPTGDELQAGWLLVLVLMAAAAALAAIHPRLPGPVLWKAFLALSAALLATCLIIGARDAWLLMTYCREGHVIESLTAAVLLVAWVLGAIITARLAMQGHPSPGAAALTAVYFLAFCRETEWGEPLLGFQPWQSRNLFRIRPYRDPSYFEQFRLEQGLSDFPLYAAHLLWSTAIVLGCLALVWYLVRHRKSLVGDLRDLYASVHGRYFVIGLAVYVMCQEIGHRFDNAMAEGGCLAWMRDRHYLTNRILDEPIELWAAACFLMSMIMLWRGRFHGTAWRNRPDHARQGSNPQPPVP